MLLNRIIGNWKIEIALVTLFAFAFNAAYGTLIYAAGTPVPEKPVAVYSFVGAGSAYISLPPASTAPKVSTQSQLSAPSSASAPANKPAAATEKPVDWDALVATLSKNPLFAGFRVAADKSDPEHPFLAVYGPDGVLANKITLEKTGDSPELAVRKKDGTLAGIIVYDSVARSVKTFAPDGQLVLSLDFSAVSALDGTGAAALYDGDNNRLADFIMDKDSLKYFKDGKPLVVYSRESKKITYLDESLFGASSQPMKSGEPPLDFIFNKESVSQGLAMIFMMIAPLIASCFTTFASGLVEFFEGMSHGTIDFVKGTTEVLQEMVEYTESNYCSFPEYKNKGCEMKDSRCVCPDQSTPVLTLDMLFNAFVEIAAIIAIESQDCNSSNIDLSSGVCYQTEALAGYNSWAGGFAPELVYSSKTAMPGNTITDKVALFEKMPAVKCKTGDVGFGGDICGSAGNRIMAEIDMPSAYSWAIRIDSVFNENNTLTIKTVAPKWYKGGKGGVFRHGYFWNGKSESNANVGTGRYIYTTFKEYKVGKKKYEMESRGAVDIVNNVNSPYGAGWWIGGLYRIYEVSESGNLGTEAGALLVDAAGGTSFYKADPTNPGQYISPTGVYSKLEKILTTPQRFTIRYRNGAQLIFDRYAEDPKANKMAFWLTKMTELNGHFLEYEYNDNANNGDQINKITDHLSDFTTRETSFNYTNNRLTSISHPKQSSEQRITNLNYDTAGNLASIVGPDGHGVWYQYDSHKLVKKDFFNDQFADGQYTEYIYNDYGRVEKVYKPDRRITYEYKPGDYLGLVNTLGLEEGTESNPSLPLALDQVRDIVTRPEGTSIYTSTADGSMTMLVDPLGRVTSTTKNSDGYDKSVSYPNGLLKTLNWSNGQLMEENYILENSVLSSNYTYYPPDDLSIGKRNKLKSVQTGTLPVTTYDYNENGTIVNSQWLGMTTTYDYLNDDHPALPSNITTSAPGAIPMSTTFGYDSAGNISTISDGKGTVILQNDNTGNPYLITDANGKTTSIEYDMMGRITSTTDAKVMTTCNWYNETGMLAAASLPAKGTCPEAPNSSYAPFYHYSYDPMNRLTTTTDPADKSDSYVYNSKGQLETYTDRNGKTTAFGYDTVGRPTDFTGQDGERIDISYYKKTDLIGSLLASGGAATIGETKIETTYDFLNRVTNINSDLAIKDLPTLTTSLSFVYNTNGQLISGAGKTFNYNSTTGLLETMTVGDVEVGYGYDGLYRANQREIEGRQKVTREYNAQGRMFHMASYAYSGGAYKTIADYTYDYDGNGNIKSMAVGGEPNAVITGMFSYTYDALNQLTDVYKPDGTSENYNYDGHGNISDTGDIVAGTAKEVYDSKTNRLLRDERCVYDYDDNGNETLKDCYFVPGTPADNANPVTYEYHYDWRNRLDEVKVYKGDSYKGLSYTVRYGYDGKGRRVWREKLDNKGIRTSLEKYTYDGNNVFSDYDEQNNVKASYITDGVDSLVLVKIAGKYYYYHTDHLGSVVAITDQDGDVVNSYRYDSYGNHTLICPMMSESIPTTERKPCIPNRYTYTSREWDEDVQLYFYRARWYDPQTGRFTQEDSKNDFKNNYYYTLNNPTNRIDPFGNASANCHRQITYMAAWKAGLSEDDSKFLREHSTYNDQENSGIREAWWAHGLGYLVFANIYLASAVELYKNGDKDEGLLQLDIAIHIVQDYYSHIYFSTGHAFDPSSAPDRCADWNSWRRQEMYEKTYELIEYFVGLVNSQ